MMHGPMNVKQHILCWAVYSWFLKVKLSLNSTCSCFAHKNALPIVQHHPASSTPENWRLQNFLLWTLLPNRHWILKTFGFIAKAVKAGRQCTLCQRRTSIAVLGLHPVECSQHVCLSVHQVRKHAWGLLQKSQWNRNESVPETWQRIWRPLHHISLDSKIIDSR
jgi:hypothetical protein